MTSSLGSHAGDGPERFADLVGALDLVMENVGMLGAIGADPRQLCRLPVDLGLDSKAMRGRPSAGNRSDRQPLAVKQDDVDRAALAHLDRGAAERRPQVGYRHARIVGIAGAVVGVLAAVGVEVVWMATA